MVLQFFCLIFVIEGVPGGNVPSGGVPGYFAVSSGCSGVFGGIPVCSGSVRVCSGPAPVFTDTRQHSLVTCSALFPSYEKSIMECGPAYHISVISLLPL